MKLFITLLVFGAALVGCGRGQNEGNSEMANKLQQFAKTEIKYDHSLLDENQKIVVKKLYRAAKIIDEIFFEQVYSKNSDISAKLAEAGDEETKEYFNIMFGPFDRLDHDKPFWGTESKPAGANFYPEDFTSKEFAEWIDQHPEDEEAFTSEFTVIVRDGEKLKAIPYSERYAEKLEKISNLLNEAAEYAENPSLKKYLTTRAKAFKTNDYFESDMAWMDLKDHTIEVIIGPYETYEDGLMGYKASFECFLTLVDPAESDKVKIFANYLNDMEAHLPIPDEYKNFERGNESPIVVVQEVFVGGDSKAGVQTLAFNLPNDERVRKAKGSKKVMLKNIHEAKFDKLLKPIAEKVMDKSQLPYVTFEAFFNHTLMHEMSHGIGPGFITVDGRETEVKKELKETYSMLEECKADILGMLNNLFMIEKGVFKADFAKPTLATFLAGVFRSVRFGINEAHGGGTAIIYNYLLEKSAYKFDKSTEKISVDFEKAEPALRDLAHKILMIQALGDYDGAKKLIADYAVVSPSMELITSKLKNLPVDIKPEYQIEKELK